MTTPTQPRDSGSAPDPTNLGYRHTRTIAGIVGMIVAVLLFAGIQYERNARAVALAAALAAHPTCPAPPPVVLPSTALQLVYSLAIPVGMPLMIFVWSVLLFSPTLFFQVLTAARGFLPWSRNNT